MQHTEIINHDQTDNTRKQRNSVILKYTILESVIIFFALTMAANIFSKFNSIALPVSFATGNVISFEATQSIATSDLLWTAFVITLCTTIFTSFVRKKLRNGTKK
jgi:hypothetical protein